MGGERDRKRRKVPQATESLDGIDGALSAAKKASSAVSAKSAAAATTAPVDSSGVPPVREHIVTYTREGMYHCDYCGKDLTKAIRIKCAVCKDFDLCLECFSVGVELNEKGHKRTHAYRVMDDMSSPLFTEFWGADEELLLLEGIDMFGLGNWQSVAEHVGSKTKEQCAVHYWQIYIDVPTFPLPAINMPLLKDRELMAAMAGASQGDSAAGVAENLGSVMQQYQRRMAGEAAGSSVLLPMPTVVDGQLQTPADGTALQPAAETESRDKHKSKRSDSKTEILGAEVGFLALRGDFEIEHDNAAEEAIADMEITDQDSPSDKEIKIKMLEIYNMKLEERARRKKFVIDRNIVDYRRHISQDKKRTKDDRLLYTKFARFLTKQQLDEFISGIIEARTIRQRIEQLKMYRQHGIRTLADGELFEQQLKKRDLELKTRTEREKNMYLTIRGTSRAARPTFDTNIMKTATPTQQKARKLSGGGLDLTGMPGVELLSRKEYDLCSNLKIKPTYYMVAKELLLHESSTLGTMQRSTARKLLNLDSNKINVIFDFFVASEWIKDEAPATSEEHPLTPAAPPTPQSAAVPAATPSSSAAAPAE